jgi:hypothetical protein
MNYFHIIVCLVLALFAVAQFNDPDPIFWLILYMGVAISAGLFFFRINIPLLPLLVTLVSIGGLVYLAPDFIIWIREGTPSITGSMQAESPHIELVREFLGCGLATFAGLGYWLGMRKRKK